MSKEQEKTVEIGKLAITDQLIEKQRILNALLQTSVGIRTAAELRYQAELELDTLKQQ